MTDGKVIPFPGARQDGALDKAGFEESLAAFLRAPDGERFQVLTFSPRPAELVRALPLDEFFWTLQALSGEEAVELIHLASPEQIQYAMDLKAWNGDRVSAKELASWVELLCLAGDERFETWFETADLEILALAFTELIRVYKLDESMPKEEAMQHLPPWTLEGVYFIEFLDKGRTPLVERALRLIRAMEPEVYESFMEGLRHTLKSEVEEEAYRLRNGRLAEFGFPAPDEALELYRLLSDTAMKRLPRRSPPHANERPAPPPRVSLLAPEGKAELPLFLAGVLDGLEPAFAEELSVEFLHLSNKALFADRSSLAGGRELLRASFARAARLVGMGLEFMSGGDAAQARALLRERFLQDLFSVGFTLISKPSKRLFAFLSLKLPDGRPLKRAPELLGGTFDELARALLQRRPRYYDARLQQEREFQSVEDLRAAERSVETVGCMLEAVRKKCPEALSALGEGGHPSVLTWLLTLFARHSLGEPAIVAPLSPSLFLRFLELWRGLGAGDREARLAAWLGEGAERGLAALASELLEEELGGLRLSEDALPNWKDWSRGLSLIFVSGDIK